MTVHMRNDQNLESLERLAALSSLKNLQIKSLPEFYDMRPPQVPLVDSVESLFINTHLKTLPSSIGLLSRIHSLRLINFEVISADVACLTNLENLSISSDSDVNPRLCRELRQLTSLKSLTIKHIKVRENLAFIGFLKQLERVEMALDLYEMPSAFCQLQHLKILLLCGCSLQQIPQEIGQLISLTHLDLENNPLKELPDQIGALVNLAFLNLRGTKMKHLPDSLCHLSKLECLRLERTRIRELPENFGELTSLQELMLGSTKPFRIKTSSFPWNYLGLEEVDFPESMNQLTSLKKLSMRGMHLKVIPTFVSSLTNLTHLHLNSNELNTYLPAQGIAAWLSMPLEWLGVRTTVFPEGLSNLTNLSMLDLEGNNLNSLPKAFSSLNLKLETTAEKFAGKENSLPAYRL